METSKRRVLNQLLGSMKLHDSNRIIVVETTHNYKNANSINLYCGKKTFSGIELPYRNNEKNISSIPRGTYPFQKIKRSSNGKNAIWIRDVPNRTEILIHQGTKPIHSKGCILLPDYTQLDDCVNTKGLIVLL
jgi:hypothetical protein